MGNKAKLLHGIRTLYFHQPHGQFSFKAGYSTIDHLQVVNQVQLKANEYNIPLRFAFVDYEKKPSTG